MNGITEITAMSSKGQVVLPKKIRDNMNLCAGTKFVVISDGENILLKPVKAPSLEEFHKVMEESRKWAQDAGITEDDIQEALKTVRSRKHKQ
jgi:AbrB family looped-hinge helix DNA binding protein